MIKAKISMDHYKCWACELTKKFEGTFFLQNTTSLEKNVASDIVYIGADGSNQEAIMNFLKSHPHMSSIEVLEKSEDHLFLLIVTAGNETMIERVNKNRCFNIGPTVLHDGREIFNIVTQNKENLQRLLDDLEKIGEVRLISVVPFTFEHSSLTKKQFDALTHAEERGYYDWPRNIDIDSLAKEKGISKSTYVEHLRKAEIKVMKQFIDKPEHVR